MLGFLLHVCLVIVASVASVRAVGSSRRSEGPTASSVVETLRQEKDTSAMKYVRDNVPAELYLLRMKLCVLERDDAECEKIKGEFQSMLGTSRSEFTVKQDFRQNRATINARIIHNWGIVFMDRAFGEDWALHLRPDVFEHLMREILKLLKLKDAVEFASLMIAVE